MKNLGKLALAALVAALCLAVATPARAEQFQEMFRLYNPNSGEHFYTHDEAEGQHAVACGWKYEGVGWNAPTFTGVPVYRLYNPNAGDHHYTLSEFERDQLVLAGWNYEGIGWNSANARSGIPVWREYNPNAVAGAHNFTTDINEHRALVAMGWHDEQIAWYGASGNVEPTAITINPNKIRLNVVESETYRLEATIDPPEAVDINVKWESEDDRIAVVNEEGVVSAMGAGTTRIVATTTNGKKGYCDVEVYKGLS